MTQTFKEALADGCARTGASAWVPGHLASVSGLDMAVTVTAALFDVDGTLVNSDPAHRHLVGGVRPSGARCAAMAAIHWAVGMGTGPAPERAAGRRPGRRRTPSLPPSGRSQCLPSGKSVMIPA